MEKQRPDCEWCGSAASIEYGVCQVCLMEYPNEATIIKLPIDERMWRHIEPAREASADK